MSDSLAAVIRPEHILLYPEEETRAAVLERLLQVVSASGVLASEMVVPARTALQAREEKGSTAIGNGLAIPHARLAQLSQVVGALAVLHDGTDFNPIDGGPVHYVILILSPRDQNALHLETLSSITRRFRNDLDRAQLSACRTVADAHAWLAAAERADPSRIETAPSSLPI